MEDKDLQPVYRNLYEAGFGEQLNETLHQRVKSGEGVIKMHHHEPDHLGLGHAFFSPEVKVGDKKLFYNGYLATTVHGLHADKVVDGVHVGMVIDDLNQLSSPSTGFNANTTKAAIVYSALEVLRANDKDTFYAIMGQFQPPAIPLSNEELDAISDYRRKNVRSAWVSRDQGLTIQETGILLADVAHPRSLHQGAKSNDPEEKGGKWRYTSSQVVSEGEDRNGKPIFSVKVYLKSKPFTDFDFAKIKNFVFPDLHLSDAAFRDFIKSIKEGGLPQLRSDNKSHPTVYVYPNIDMNTYNFKSKYGKFIQHTFMKKGPNYVPTPSPVQATPAISAGNTHQEPGSPGAETGAAGTRPSKSEAKDNTEQANRAPENPPDQNDPVTKKQGKGSQKAGNTTGEVSEPGQKPPARRVTPPKNKLQ